MTILAGYISDRGCPGNAEHGRVLDLRDGGYYCPHHEHDFPVVTKNHWSEDEFQAAKSPATSTTPGAVKIILPKTKKARRRR